MIEKEPTIRVGIMEGRQRVNGRLNGVFHVDGYGRLTGLFEADVEGENIVVRGPSGAVIIKSRTVHMAPLGPADFTLFEVRIGIDFHWERSEAQTFQGELMLKSAEGGLITVINTISLESYLISVISSEMSAAAPVEFLKAHAVTARSWLVAVLMPSDNRAGKKGPLPEDDKKDGEYIRWYGREAHGRFDVCADDHCQRYQGVTRLISSHAKDACEATRGVFLVHEDHICDARYHKACGGLTDNFENVWEARVVPYLTSVSDAAVNHLPVHDDRDAHNWIMSSPEAYCNTSNQAILRNILPDFDQETGDFFRWQVLYTAAELEEILRTKSGMDFGRIRDIRPLERGPSGRIVRLRIEGSKKSLVIGKELEIRRCLSIAHLLSSAFIVEIERDPIGLPQSFTFHAQDGAMVLACVRSAPLSWPIGDFRRRPFCNITFGAPN